MRLTVDEPREFEHTVVPDDCYSAKVSRVDTAEMKHGETVIVEYRIGEGDHNGKVVSGLYKPSVNTESKLGKCLTALGFELSIGSDVDLEDMAGRSCRVVTERKKLTRDDGSSYELSSVKSVLPVK